jgi:hypothetical protein
LKLKNKFKKMIKTKKKSKEWGPNWIQKLNEINCWGMKLKKSTLKSIKNKTNNSQKNKDKKWYKYKVTKHIWFLKGLSWNPRLWERQ